MFKSTFVFLYLTVVGISLWGAYCLTPEEESAITESLKPIVVNCIDECGLSEEDVKKDKHDDMDPCFKKCFLKKMGLMTDEGKYDRDGVRQQVLTYTDNEEEADKVQNTLDECFKDKEEELKDDKDAEMKRVDIIFECLKNFKQE